MKEESAKLKRIAADQALDMLNDLAEKTMVDPQAKRTPVARIQQAHGASERRVCGLLGSRCTMVCGQAEGGTTVLRKPIAELSAERPRFG